METKRMTAEEALSKARATMECGGDYRAGCLITQQREETGGWPWADALNCMPSTSHGPAASALLDGFSVAQLTKAGG